ncbi:MAG: class I SAM-dependent methyltransferase [Verrucomicrobiales bacterium]
MTTLAESDPKLVARLREEIADAEGWISFDRFMEAALYDPEHGYYGSGRARVGRGGDFFTSVSVGEVYGVLLGKRIARWWEENGKPSAWQLAEQGANDGRLLADVISSLPEPCRAAAEIVIIEPSERTRAVQTETMAALGATPRWLKTPSAMEPALPTVYFANELLDAFPIERLRFENGQWSRLGVGYDTESSSFQWASTPWPCEWSCHLPAEEIGPFPDGYTTELCTRFGSWAEGLVGLLSTGLVLLADYGFEEEDYFHRTRTEGTLRTYRDHRALDDPFAAIGHSDITAHVNWTRVASALAKAGFAVSPSLDQGRWLTRVGMDWLLDLEKNPVPDTAKRLRQFQTLTHPQHLGGKFQILEALRMPSANSI